MLIIYSCRLAVLMHILLFAQAVDNVSDIGEIKSGESITCGERFLLPKTEIALLEGKALDGSPDPAFRLYLHYAFGEQDNNLGMFWLTISAENGQLTAQYNLGSSLSEDPDPKIRRRALYWLRLAAKGGYKRACDELCYILGEVPSECRSFSAIPEECRPENKKKDKKSEGR